MERPERSDFDLDAEYVEYLAMIRPFMEALPDTAHQDVQQCRVWLHRLTNGLPRDRYMRNVYMAELCRQLRAGRLDDPFDSQPPTGMLQPRLFSRRSTQGEDKDGSSMWSDVTDTTHFASMDWQTITEGSTNAGSVHSSEAGSPGRTVDHSCCLQTQRNLEERIADLQGQVNRCQRAMDYCVLNGKSKDGLPRIDDLDSKLGSLYEKKLHSMITTIEKLKLKNETLNKEVAQYKKTIALGTSTASCSITNLNKEISTLVIKIDELEKIKTAMAANHEEVEAEHKQLIAGHLQDLNRRLTEAERKNCELQDSLQRAVCKSRQLEIDMAERESENNKYWQAKLLKEAGVYEETLSEVERSYSTRLEEKTRQVEELSTQLGAKTKEVVRLNEVLNDQCQRMKDEMLSLKREKGDESELAAKVAELRLIVATQKRTIKKLEYGKTKAVHEYERKIIQTEIDMDSLVRKLSFENSTQRAKLALSLNRGELDNEVMVLEKRYKHLFDDMVEASLKQRQEDLKKIRDLEDMLLLTPHTKTSQNFRSVIVVDSNNLTEGKSVTVVPVDAE